MIPKTVTYCDAEGEEHECELPSHWEICSHCNGTGMTSAHLGSFTTDDFDEDPDFMHEYMSGSYDIGCRHCNATGKVLEIDYERCTSDEQKAALQWLSDQAAWRRESFEERKRESLMLGESTLRDWDGCEP